MSKPLSPSNNPAKCKHLSWRKEEDDGSWTCQDCGLNKWEPVVPPSSAAAEELPTPIASNNLKEQVLKLTKAVWRLGRGTALDLPLDPELAPEDAATQILNLILDTILASEEMQDEITDGALGDINEINEHQNATKAQIRAILERLRT